MSRKSFNLLHNASYNLCISQNTLIIHSLVYAFCRTWNNFRKILVLQSIIIRNGIIIFFLSWSQELYCKLAYFQKHFINHPFCMNMNWAKIDDFVEANLIISTLSRKLFYRKLCFHWHINFQWYVPISDGWQILRS